MPSPSSELKTAFADGAVLLGTSSAATSSNNLEIVLQNRLFNYYARVPTLETRSGKESLQDLQLSTGIEALHVVKRIQNVLDALGPEQQASSEGSPGQAPAVGTRDLAQIRTLLSLTLKWAVEPLFLRISELWLGLSSKNQGSSRIVDLTVGKEDSPLLSELIASLFSLIFPEGVQGRISQTLVTTTLLSLHPQDILLPSISLGWLPESQASNLAVPLHEARPLVTRFLRLLTPAQAISALTNVISSTPLPPIHARKACAQFLTKQIIRPYGIRGLCEAAFTADQVVTDDSKLEQIAKTVNSVPSGMNEKDYYTAIFPQVRSLLLSDAPSNFKRTAAFIIFRAIVPQDTKQSTPSHSDIVLAMFQRPFLENLKPSDPQGLLPRDALWTLTVLMSNTEPSPIFVSRLLSPIIENLYALSFDLEHNKTTDPQLKETATGLLLSWGKIVDQVEGSEKLWSIIANGRDYEWKFDLEGNFSKIESSESSKPALFMPGDIKGEDDNEDGLDTNIFDLFPDPVHFVELLKKLDRGDIASSLFIKLLESYRDTKGRANGDPIKTLHILQIIMQMQKRLFEGTTSNILRKPDQLLSFIFHVLDAASITSQAEGGSNVNQRSPHEEMLEEVDSDDEAPNSEILGPDDELLETAITLLLSILEADESLTARIHPIFNEIFVKLEPLALEGSSALRPLAREARLVITARLANVSGSKKSGPKKEADEDVRQVYQKALKLLQDPILPVRAHGLLLLRELVSNSSTKNHKVDSALVPSILSIFLQAVQDEDSYMYLNAVQGLAALAETFGKEIIQGLIHDYAGGLDGLGGGNLTEHELDIRIRIGEALGSVINRCGIALGLYVDILVPPLFATIRNFNIPTTLRTSSISLLAECVDTYALAMMPYVEDLSQTMIDLLQAENVPTHGRNLKSEEVQQESESRDTGKGTAPTMDSDPTSKQSKFPPLRRAAVHFLSLLIRASTKLVYDETDINFAQVFPRAAVRRISVTLGYMSSTDEDNMVRLMARETRENLEELQRAVFGL